MVHNKCDLCLKCFSIVKIVVFDKVFLLRLLINKNKNLFIIVFFVKNVICCLLNLQLATADRSCRRTENRRGRERMREEEMHKSEEHC